MRLGMREAAKYKRSKSRLPSVLACLQGSGTHRVALAQLQNASLCSCSQIYGSRD